MRTRRPRAERTEMENTIRDAMHGVVPTDDGARDHREQTYVKAESRKEQTWRAIQQNLATADAFGTDLSTRRKTHRRRKTIASTTAAVLAGISVVAYAIHVFHPTTTHRTATHSKQHVHQKTLPTGAVQTNLPVPQINPGNDLTAQMMSPVSPNGNWMVVSSDGKSRVICVDGSTSWQVPANIGMIYGQTPDGNLILGDAAGGGGVTEVLNPVTGAVQKLPGKADPKAHWAYYAAESSTGHWVMSVANSMGAGPGQKFWVDMDGKKVPANQPIGRPYTWSPDGRTLAAVYSPPFHAATTQSNPMVSEQIVLYDAATGQSQSLAVTKVSKRFANTVQYTAWSSALHWSPDGRYLLYQFWNDLYVYDTVSGRVLKLPVSPGSDQFGFLPDNQVYVTNATNRALYTFSVLGDTVHKTLDWHTDSGMNHGINGVVPDGTGLLIGLGGSMSGGAYGGGRIIELQNGKTTTIVPRHADLWWFDSVDHRLYYFYQNLGGQFMGHVMSAPVQTTGSTTSGALGSNTSTSPGGQS